MANGSVTIGSCANEEDKNASVSIFVNSGDWSANGDKFEDRIDIIVCNDCSPAEVAFADMDRDGDFDLVVSAADGDGVYGSAGSWGIYISFQDGSHQFGAFTQVADEDDMATPVRGLAVVDFDGEDGSDVVVVGDDCYDGWPNSGNDQVYVFSNDGDGGLTLPAAYPDDLGLPGTDDVAYDVTVADFDKDSPSSGKPDFISCNIGSDRVSLQTNNGDFSFSQSNRTDACESGFNFSDIGSGLFNPGTAYDFAAVNELGTAVKVFYGDSSGGFSHDCDEHAEGGDYYNITRSGCTAVAQTVSGIAVGHLNGGTRLDLAATRSGCSEVAILLGESALTPNAKFQFDRTESDYFISADPPGEDDAAEIVRVLIVDLDADGFGDLVTANRLSRNISVMIDQLSITP